MLRVGVGGRFDALRKSLAESLARNTALPEVKPPEPAKNPVPENQVPWTEIYKKYSKARLILPLRAVEKSLLGRGDRLAPTRIKITFLDGKVMRYWNDGSLRHTMPRGDRETLRKQMKRDRLRAAAAQRMASA